jgi:iron(III) transport system permease protein
MDQSLEDAAAMSGARWRQILRRVTLPLSAPTLLGVFVLSLISGLEAFEVPLLVGIPAGTEVVSTHIYRLSYVSLFPSQSASSAFSVALIVIVLALIVPYHRATRRGSRYTVIGGKGYRPRRLPLGRWRWLGGAILLIQPLLLLAPLLLLLWTSFLRYYISPSEPHLPSLTFENYAQVVRFPGLGSAVMHSVTASVVAATAVLVLCMVAGWGISRAKARWGTAVDAVYSVPLVFPGIVLSLALFTMSLDIPNPIYGTVWIISLAYIIHYLPYGMRYAHPAFLSVHIDLEDTARVAGATTRSIFVRILAPLLRPSVLALWLYVFLLSVHELSIPIMLVGPNSHVISTATLDMWNDGQLTIVAAFTSLLAVVLTLLALALQKLAARVGLLG